VSVAVQAILEGMPEPSDLRCTETDGHTVITIGDRVVSCFDSADVGMRNLAVVTLVGLGFTGRRVAEAVGLTPEYVSILRSRARRDGSAGLVRPRGRRPKLSAAQVTRARVWRAQGVSDVQIGARLGVSDKTAARVLDDGEAPAPVPVAVQPALGLTGVDEPEPVTACAPPAAVVPEPALAGAFSGGSARIGSGSFASRYAGAMLLHAFFDRVNVAVVLSTATRAAGGRYDDLAVLTGTCMAFGLGIGSLEAAKHLVCDQAGPLACHANCVSHG
jgi:hypothetical protein